MFSASIVLMESRKLLLLNTNLNHFFHNSFNVFYIFYTRYQLGDGSSIMVACWSADQQVKQSVPHLGHGSYQNLISVAQVVPVPGQYSFIVHNHSLKRHLFPFISMYHFLIQKEHTVYFCDIIIALYRREKISIDPNYCYTQCTLDSLAMVSIMKECRDQQNILSLHGYRGFF